MSAPKSLPHITGETTLGELAAILLRHDGPSVEAWIDPRGAMVRIGGARAGRGTDLASAFRDGLRLFRGEPRS